MPDLYLKVGDTVKTSLVDYFGHECGSQYELSYTARSTDPAVTVSISERDLTTASIEEADSVRVVVTATDTAGKSAPQRFSVWVEHPNRAPVVVDSVVNRIGDVEVRFRSFEEKGSVSGSISDPDGDSLEFRAESADTFIAKVGGVWPHGSRFTVYGEGIGSTTITIMATDPDSLSASFDVNVTVIGG